MTEIEIVQSRLKKEPNKHIIWLLFAKDEPAILGCYQFISGHWSQESARRSAIGYERRNQPRRYKFRLQETVMPRVGAPS